ncbi:uncharacterized protein PFL1_05219 [Pseudozyma flocculosa PF-1]|uniref:RING-type E3 ubiquitin transferase n=1 Tax=Pseudozyma flocculosa PF-1 TaxID=1277687 RepID=A0A061H9L7_9BASI|nr:uncharacterized protein PFL1_05219 [Pseudozyma flocculosa PF-1]EPQ27296.1 hypothetical protein PFL1_05219 [Pseudozyma flocculosa PF-1]
MLEAKAAGSDEDHADDDNDDDDDGPTCLICLGPIEDLTVLPLCQHSCFCFECIVRWAELKRKCPLCQRSVGPYVVHSIRADDDCLRYHLRPPIDAATDGAFASSSSSSTSSPYSSSTLAAQQRQRQQENESIRRQLAHRVGARRPARRPSTEAQRDADLALARRKHVYRTGSYVLHVGSNRYTGFHAPPTPSRIATSATLQQRLAAFVRRDLYAWPNLDVEFLTTYTLSIMKSLDIQSNEAINLLSDFLGPDGAPHFAHEVATFLRSGRDLKAYDACRWVRYPMAPAEAAPAAPSAAAAAAAAAASASSSSSSAVVAGSRGVQKAGRPRKKRRSDTGALEPNDDPPDPQPHPQLHRCERT